MLGVARDRLQLPPMTSDNQEHMGSACTMSVDVSDGITTGISAADRARTMRTLVDSATEPYEIVRPGHVFPLRYAEGGVLRRAGHTEAAVDLARLAGLTPAGVVAEIFNDDGTMARLPQLREFADEHGLALVSIAQLIEYRRHSELTVRRVVETRVPNQHGVWRAVGYRNSVDGTEHRELGLPADAREYSTGAQMLADLGVRSLRLLTNNPAKMRGLSGFGIEVTGRVSLPVAATEDNLRYLIAKRDRLGHQLDNLFIPNGSAAPPGPPPPAHPPATHPPAGGRAPAP